ncbi:MAG: hypothetical protein M0024_10530 [Nitrospiraceae bacterium]|nr:hypothetical protein [Nitrospiraceae bacterium]
MAKKTLQTLSGEDLKKIKVAAEEGDTSWLKKEKKFLLDLPGDLHKVARQAAFDSGISLHDYILQCVKIVTDVLEPTTGTKRGRPPKS